MAMMSMKVIWSLMLVLVTLAAPFTAYTGQTRMAVQAVPVAEAAPEAIDGDIAMAREALDAYMGYWQAQDYENLPKMALPRWCDAQPNGAQQQLYWNHNFWLVSQWTIDETAETAMPGAVALKLTVDANKRNGASTPGTIVFLARLEQVDGTWYVNPDSLVTEAGVVTLHAEEAPAEPVKNISPAVQALDAYMASWQAQDYETMASCALPAWMKAQGETGAQQLYWNHNFWLVQRGPL